jgi:hypothetical protein
MYDISPYQAAKLLTYFHIKEYKYGMCLPPRVLKSPTCVWHLVALGLAELQVVLITRLVNLLLK